MKKKKPTQLRESPQALNYREFSEVCENLTDHLGQLAFGVFGGHEA